MSDPLLDKPDGLPDWVPSADDERSLRWLRIAVRVVIVAGVMILLARGGSEPADPVLGDRAPLEGFAEIDISLSSPDAATVLEWCVLLAETAEQRAKGLMEVTDPHLGGYVGMLFTYEEPTEGGFWMRNTPLPLTIAYFDGDGTWVSARDMEPCEDSADCPSYPPKGPYRAALEVPQGLFADVGADRTWTLAVAPGNAACAA